MLRGLTGLMLLLTACAGPAAAMDQSAVEETNCLMACDANQENCGATGHAPANKYRSPAERLAGEAQQGHRDRELHAVRRRCLLRLQSDQADGGYRLELPGARTVLGRFADNRFDLAQQVAPRLIHLGRPIWPKHLLQRLHDHAEE